MRTELPSGKAPTTRVRRRISRPSRSMTLFVIPFRMVRVAASFCQRSAYHVFFYPLFILRNLFYKLVCQKKNGGKGRWKRQGSPLRAAIPPPLRKGAGDLGKTQEKITDICNATPGPCNRRRGCVPGSRRCRSPLRPGGTAPPCWCSIPLGCRWGWPGR